MKRRNTTTQILLHPGFRVVLFGVVMLTTLALTLPQFSKAVSSTPKVLGYQGRLTDASKVPVADGAKSMKFAIFTAVSGGTCLWSAGDAAPADGVFTLANDCPANVPNTTISVTVTDSLFNVVLGDTTGGIQNAIPDSVFNSTSTRYLEVTISGETLSPRKPIGGAPFALSAELLDGLDSSATGGSVAFVPVTDASGNLVLSTNLTVDTNTLFVNSATDRVGIGTVTPAEQLEITGNFRLPASTATTGVIYAGASAFLHNLAGVGGNDTFLGIGAGNLTTTGNNNTGIGAFALAALTDGERNTAVGVYALTSHSGGAGSNTAIGYQAMFSNTIGSSNVAVGDAALYFNLNGVYNIGIGSNALNNNETGSNNIAIGTAALVENVSATGNIAIGGDALRNTTLGTNIAIGTDAGESNTTGQYNIFLGSGAGDTYSVSDSNQFIAGSDGAATDNVYFGKGARNAAPTTYTINGTGGLGTNIAGGAMTLAGGRGTGTGAGGALTFSTAAAGGAGSSLNALSERMRIDTSGNVGIGTASPTNLLHIQSTTTPQFRNAYDSSNFTTMSVASNGAATFDANGAGAAFTFSDPVNITGNLNPAADDTYDLGTAALRWRDLYLGPTTLHIKSLASETSTARDWKLSIQETDGASEGNLRLLEGSTEVMNITPGGNVGIGTATPGGTLTISSPNITGLLTSSAMSLTANSMTSGTGFYATSTSLSSGRLMDIQVSGTAAASDTQTALNVQTVGPNATSTQTTYGLQVANTHTGISSTNIAGYFTASNGINNYGLLVAAGSVGIGTVSPGSALDVKGTLRLSGSTSGYVGLAPAAAAGSTTYTLPSADGASGQVLSTNGSGALSWAAAGGSGDITAVGSMTSGDAFADSTADDDWLGLGAAAGRIEFDDLATDEVNILSANVGIGTASPTATLTLTPPATSGTSDTTRGWFQVNSATYTDNATAGSGTAAAFAFSGLQQPTLAATNVSVTTTDAATLYIANSPANGTNMTVTNPWALWVDAGNSRFDGHILPGADNTYDLGSAALRWRDLYLGPASLNIYSTTTTAGGGTNDVLGELKFTGVTDAAALNLTTTNNGTATGGQINLTSARPSGGATDAALNLTTSTDLGVSDELIQFGDSAGTFLTMLGNGNVGIGDASPAALLTVGSGDLFQVSSAGLVSTTPSSNSNALTITGSSITSARLVNLDTRNTSGTLENLAYGAATTLSGAIIAEAVDLKTSVTNAAQSITGYSLTLPGASAASTTTIKGITIAAPGAVVNSAGDSTWTGLDLTMPDITQTAGTLTSTGIKITAGSITTGGEQYGIAVDGAGVGVAGGVLRGVSINTITGGVGEEFALMIGGGWDRDIIFIDPSPSIAFPNGARMSWTDGNDELALFADLNINFGLAVDAGAFMSRNSAVADEFNIERGDLSADTAGAGGNGFGDAQAWGVYESAAVGCTFSTVDDTVNGIFRMDPGATTVGCMAMLDSALNDTHTVLDADNLPVMLMKVRPSAIGVDNVVYVGMSNETDGLTTAPPNFIGFSNDDGTPDGNWYGVVRTAASQSTTASCGAASTTQFALMKVEVRSTTDVHFFIDTDVSNGVAWSECGTGLTTNIPTAALAPELHYQSRATTAGVLDVDFFRAWQDDSKDLPANYTSKHQKSSDTENRVTLAQLVPARNLNLEPGTLVTMDPLASVMGAEPAKIPHDPYLLGVVVKDAALVLGNGTFDGVKVATAGRTSIKVSSQNGLIKKGDWLTSSTLPGVAMKATNQGPVIGYALQNADSSLDSIMIQLQVQSGFPVNNASGATIATTQNFQIYGDLDFAGYAINNIKAIRGLNWSLDETGALIVKTATADEYIVRQSDEKATIGEGKMLMGLTTIDVINPAVRLNSKVFISWNDDPGTRSWIANKHDGGFSVQLASPATSDARFDYWIINVVDARTASPMSVIPSTAEGSSSAVVSTDSGQTVVSSEPTPDSLSTAPSAPAESTALTEPATSTQSTAPAEIIVSEPIVTTSTEPTSTTTTTQDSSAAPLPKNDGQVVTEPAPEPTAIEVPAA